MRIWNSDNLCRELASELEELRKKTSWKVEKEKIIKTDKGDRPKIRDTLTTFIDSLKSERIILIYLSISIFEKE